MTADVDQPTLEHLYKVYYDDLNMCGCGYTDAAWQLIRDTLAYFNDRDAAPALDATLGENPGAQQVVLSALDHAELIDHGTSLHASWLTPKGKWVLTSLNQVGVDRMSDKLDHVGYPHYDPESREMGECTEECWRDECRPA